MVNITKLGSSDFNTLNASHPDAIFAILAEQEIRGVGVDAREGVFVILKSGTEKIYPVFCTKSEKDISDLAMVAVEVEDASMFDSVVKQLERFSAYDS